MGIRFILLQIAIFGLCAGALANPLIGLYGYLWYSLARPDAIAWSENVAPYSMGLAIFTLVGAWRYFANTRAWMRNPWVWSMLLLQVFMALSVVMAPNPALAWDPYVNFLKYFVVALLIPLYVVNLREFRWMIFVVAFAMGLLGFRFGVFGLRAGGIHIESGLSGFMSENNTLAMALLMGLPFVWYSRELITQAWIKTGILIVVFTTMAAVIMTESRGGILTLGVLCLIFVYRSRHKLLILAVVVLCVVPVILLVQDRFVARMSTLANVEEDNSASSRMRYQVAALKLWKDYPLFGVGYGTLNWVAMSPRYLGTSNEGQHVIHNNYLQMATDSGTFAFLILMWQIFYSLWWLNGTAKRLKETHPGLTALPRAMEGSLIAFAVDSTFTSRTDYDFYYFLILMVGAWYTVYNTDLPATESAPARQPVVAPAVKIGPSVPAPAAVLAEQRRLRTPSSPLRSRGNQG